MVRLINQRLSRGAVLSLGALPFAIAIIVYMVASDIRRAENPNDKLLPSLEQMADTFQRMAFERNRRSGDVLLWSDTGASLRRLGLGVGLAAAIGLTFGILIGLVPLARSTLNPFVAALSLIPPLSILPILFIVFGLGEVAKVTLIAVGVTPFLIRDLSQRVAEIPNEQLVKAQTLGASSWQIAMRVALPQVMPRMITAVRLALGPAWLFLIAAEAIAATGGLGYRIFLVRRFLAMDVILPYVVWITCLAYCIDWVLRRISARGFRWAHLEGDQL